MFVQSIKYRTTSNSNAVSDDDGLSLNIDERSGTLTRCQNLDSPLIYTESLQHNILLNFENLYGSISRVRRAAQVACKAPTTRMGNEKSEKTVRPSLI